MFRMIVTVALVAFGSFAFGAQQYQITTVIETLVIESDYGGCMAKLANPPGSNGLDCPSQWVSFSCTGDFNSPEVGYKKLETAQLALMTDTRVKLVIDDAKKHYGFCFAHRIGNFPN